MQWHGMRTVRRGLKKLVKGEDLEMRWVQHAGYWVVSRSKLSHVHVHVCNQTAQFGACLQSVEQ